MILVGWAVLTVSCVSQTSDPVQAALGSIVRIQTDSRDYIRGGRTVGTGFFLEWDGFVVSAAHTIPDPAPAVIEASNGPDTFTLAVVAVNRELDLALLRPEMQLEAPPPGIAYGGAADLGQRVRVIGFPVHIPAFSGPYVTSGVVSSVNVAPEGCVAPCARYATDAFATVGNSGGPVIDETGRFIGVVVAILSAEGPSYGGTTLFVPAASVKSFVEEQLAAE